MNLLVIALVVAIVILVSKYTIKRKGKLYELRENGKVILTSSSFDRITKGYLKRLRVKGVDRYRMYKPKKDKVGLIYTSGKSGSRGQAIIIELYRVR